MRLARRAARSAFVLAAGIATAVLAAALPVVTATPAAAGQLDAGFGRDGMVRYDPARPSVDVAHAGLRADGLTWVAGAVGDKMGIARLPRHDSDPGERVTLDFGPPATAHSLIRGGAGLLAGGTAGGDFALAELDGNLNVYRSDATRGLHRTSFGGPALIRSLALGSGGVLAAGGATVGQGGSVALARYSYGSYAPDPSFGTGGKVLDDVTPGDDAAYAATSERVVAGRAGSAALVARYNPDGSRDTSFGSGGVVLLDITPLDDVAHAIAWDAGGPQRRGGYVLAGAAGTSAFVARLLGDGTPDTSFADNGVLLTNLGGLSARFTALAFPPYWDATKFLLGAVVAGVGGADAAIVRLDPTGRLDGSFGTGGVTVTDFGSTADVVTLVKGSEPTLALAGGDGADMVLASYLYDGTLSGIQRAGFGAAADDAVAGSARLPDGKTLVVATRWPGGLYLVRFHPDGTPDPSFGEGGLADPALGSGARAYAMTLAPDGKVLVAFEMSSSAFVARFLPDGALDPSFGRGGLAAITLLVPRSTLLGWRVVVLADGRVLVAFNGGGTALLSSSGVLESGFGRSGVSYVSAPDPVLLSEPGGTALALYGDASYCRGLRAQRIASDGTTSLAWCGAPGLWPTSAVRLLDGRILVAGTTDSGEYPARTSSDSLVAAVLPNGAPDLSFGTVGYVRLDLGNHEHGARVATAPGGTIVVGTRSRNSWDDSALSLGRVLASGRTDRSFGKGGAADLAAGWLVDLAVQPDGKVMVTSELPGERGRDVGLARYVPAGSATVVARAWGWNAAGTLGNGTKVDAHSPVGAGLTNVRSVAAGWYHSMAVLDDGSVWAWGWNGLGQLGTSGPDTTTPSRVGGLPPAMAVAAGPYHSLALAVDGSVWAWGWNGTAQLGDGTTANRPQPVRVPITGNVVAIAAGAGHSLALHEDGSVWAWGWNATGQLGDGTATDRPFPTKVYEISQVVGIAAGGLHSLAVRMDGTVMAWGWNGVGQLGVGQAGDAWIPIFVPQLTGVVQVATGIHHSLALKRDGTVVAWGWNPLGQLGDGTTTTRFAPVAARGLRDVERVAAGIYHSLALKTDGTVWGWGWNGVGQLGNGSVSDRLTPVRATQIADATTISGAAHTLAA
ncbi:MAG: hypothetical protein M3314_08665 [Actinomycetota bacterium]|nr:hypothetical protein [Actinomycetota bacterium]